MGLGLSPEQVAAWRQWCLGDAMTQAFERLGGGGWGATVLMKTVESVDQAGSYGYALEREKKSRGPITGV